MSQNIAQSSEEQAQGVDQITKAMHQLDQVTQTNAGAAERTASSADALSGQATSLKSIVRTLTSSVLGENAAKTREGGGSIVAAVKASVLKSPVSKPFVEQGIKEPKVEQGLLKKFTRKKSEPSKRVDKSDKVEKIEKSEKPEKKMMAKLAKKKENVVPFKKAETTPEPVATIDEPKLDKVADSGGELAVPSENDPRFKDI
jgi:methyl-accepting chemotaxis protein